VRSSVVHARRVGIIGGVALLAALGTAPAAAQQPVCAATTQMVAFADYDERSLTPASATGQVRVACDTTGTPYAVSLDAGTHSGGSFSSRVMTDAGGLYSLEYNLFIDSSRTQIWGDGTGATVIVSGTAQGAQDILQVFGQIPALQPVGVGLYADTVTATVEY